MKYGKLLLTLVFALGGPAFAASAIAGDSGHSHETHAQLSYEGYGVVKVVNANDGKVKIAHEPISALEWPAMTMWFVLSAPLPQGIGEGDSVRFELQQENGKWVIGRIEQRRK